jgi:hypothetical protein
MHGERNTLTHLPVIEHNESIPLGFASGPRVVRELNVGYFTEPLEGLVKVNSRIECRHTLQSKKIA